MIQLLITLYFGAILTPVHCNDCPYPEDLIGYDEPITFTTDEIIEMIGMESDLTQTEIERFKRIAHCESTNNPEAVSPGGGNHGLFQLNVVHDWDREKVYDPEYNTRYAMQVIYPIHGWRPWPNCPKI